ncbi:MAG: glycosyltransferase family 4 protein [Paenibacillaceae bacterium]|nr:glycosyltransferase family 4 protein [Paenibacillaceae bacterium]
MNKVSIAFPVSYGKSGPNQKYMPLIKQLNADDMLERCYGIGFPQTYVFFDEPLQKMVLTKFTTRFSRIIVKSICKIFGFPKYMVYWSNVWLFDFMFHKKIASDKSKVLFTTPLLRRTIRAAKKKGKLVVLEAGNSEPRREYQRIINEYQTYGIKKRYIYGNPNYKNTCLESFKLADKIITISNVSMRTYLNAGYDMSKFKLISMCGSDMKIQLYKNNIKRQKAFISTGYHNFIKGTHLLLKAWEKAKISNIPLIIVGDLCEDMKEFVEKFGPFDNVNFVGSRTDLQDWYQQFDAVGILLSLSEGAGRVTPEMMKFGFPMIVSSDATCDLVIDGYNGFITDPFDEERLVTKLNYFAEDWRRVHELYDAVINTVASRSIKDYSLECAEYLKMFIS